MAVKSATVVAFCVLSALVCLSSAQPIDFDPEYEQLVLAVEGFEPIPLRVKRGGEWYGGVRCRPGQYTRCDGNVGIEGTIYDNGRHRFDGRAEVSKAPSEPTTVGGGLDYTGPHGGASFTADHNRQMGTNVGVEGRYNIYSSPDRQTTIDATGGYQRSYGGQYGTSPPDYNVGVEVKTQI